MTKLLGTVNPDIIRREWPCPRIPDGLAFGTSLREIMTRDVCRGSVSRCLLQYWNALATEVHPCPTPPPSRRIPAARGHQIAAGPADRQRDRDPPGSDRHRRVGRQGRGRGRRHPPTAPSPTSSPSASARNSPPGARFSSAAPSTTSATSNSHTTALPLTRGQRDVADAATRDHRRPTQPRAAPQLAVQRRLSGGRHLNRLTSPCAAAGSPGRGDHPGGARMAEFSDPHPLPRTRRASTKAAAPTAATEALPPARRLPRGDR